MNTDRIARGEVRPFDATPQSSRYAQGHSAGSVNALDVDANCTILRECKRGEPRVDHLDALVRAGEDLFARDQYGDTALTFCARCRKNETFRFLWEHPCVPLEGRTIAEDGSKSSTESNALCDAFTSGRLSPGLILAAGGIDPCALHCLHTLVDAMDLSERRRLESHALLDTLVGVNPLNILTKLAADGVLSAAYKVELSQAAWSGNTDLMAYLLEGRQDVNIRDGKGRTALSILGKVGTANRHPQCNFIAARMLEAAHADPNLADNNGIVPLMMAAKSGCGPMMAILYRAGGDLEARDKEDRGVLDHLNIFVGDIKEQFSTTTALAARLREIAADPQLKPIAPHG